MTTPESSQPVSLEKAPRLIERVFPLKHTSIDSVYEKQVRHGHISTLHIWPARRPLAACRAALLATLLPDPGAADTRRLLLERIGGKIVSMERKRKLANGKVVVDYKEETEGGVLHWGRESNPEMDRLRDEIRKAYDGRTPRVLDPFAGGGAIPLEAVRLGCDVTASDINPVSWFILKGTLDYPGRFGAKKWPLPQFATDSEEFMEEYRKGTDAGRKPAKAPSRHRRAGRSPAQVELVDDENRRAKGAADLSWHVRAWGHWVLEQSRRDLKRWYTRSDGKAVLAFLWTRSVPCKNCRGIIPLLKSMWLSKPDRVLLEFGADSSKLVVRTGVAEAGGNTTARRDHDRRLGLGTMSRNGAWCPHCGKAGTVAMKMDDIRDAGKHGRLGVLMTAVVVEGPRGREYLPVTPADVELAKSVESELANLFASIPNGFPHEPLPGAGALGISVPLYGFNEWGKLFTPRQLFAIGTFVRYTRAARDAMRQTGYSDDVAEAIHGYLGLSINRFVDFANSGTTWRSDSPHINHSFSRFALPVTWDFGEANPLGDAGGSFKRCYERIATCLDKLVGWSSPGKIEGIHCRSATERPEGLYDAIITDPPYYGALPYSDIMDMFHIWFRRTLKGLSPLADDVFRNPLGPKWDHGRNDGELVDDPSRFGGNRAQSKAAYEDGMWRAFKACRAALRPDGTLVVAFANKQPEAWETLVAALIRAGFVVVCTWPVQTEQPTRMRSQKSAALASSVWLVCKNRSASAPAGWDTEVLRETRSKIYERLREFWDAGIRGPDFVWAATGPALEAYSKHPVVKKANDPGQVMTVSEFLRHVRRIVVDFVVGRVLSHDGDGTVAVGLDDVTTYYLLHRHDFGLDDAPAGACILYAISCGLSDTSLGGDLDVLVRTGAADVQEDEEGPSDEDESEPDAETGTGNTARLKPWNQRTRKAMGYDAGGKDPPLIDRIHRLMHLWRAGDVAKVDEYLENRLLLRNATFHQVLQALIELSKEGGDERRLLESLSNHCGARGGMVKKAKSVFDFAPTNVADEGGKPK